MNLADVSKLCKELGREVASEAEIDLDQARVQAQFVSLSQFFLTESSAHTIGFNYNSVGHKLFIGNGDQASRAVVLNSTSIEPPLVSVNSVWYFKQYGAYHIFGELQFDENVTIASAIILGKTVVPSTIEFTRKPGSNVYLISAKLQWELRERTHLLLNVNLRQGVGLVKLAL